MKQNESIVMYVLRLAGTLLLITAVVAAALAEAILSDLAKKVKRSLHITPEALEVLSRPDTLELMQKYGVLSNAELLARKEIQIENYEKLIDIEAKTCLNMLQTIYLPAPWMKEGENEIVEVFQEGFKCGDKVIRFAMVKVAN